MDYSDILMLARVVVGRIKPKVSGAISVDDLVQAASVTGLQSFRAAGQRGATPKRSVIMLQMRTTVLRLLAKRSPSIINVYECLAPAERSPLDDREQAEHYLSMLKPKAARTLRAYFGGQTVKQIADDEGIQTGSVSARISTALKLLRSMAMKEGSQ